MKVHRQKLRDASRIQALSLKQDAEGIYIISSSLLAAGLSFSAFAPLAMTTPFRFPRTRDISGPRPGHALATQQAE